jgi:hypothetical protein
MAISTLGFLCLAAVKAVFVSHAMPTAADPSAEGDSKMGKIFGSAMLETFHSVGSSCLAASASLTVI